MRIHRIDLGDDLAGLELGYVEWGDGARARTVVCVHGLTRNARDFDALAAALAPSARVICVDVAGRGGSAWLDDPQAYRVPVYAHHLRRLLARLGLEAVDWVGTSMGGLIGMTVAGAPGSPIRRLVLNDIGPFVPLAALEPIKAYLGLDLRFPTIESLEGHLRQIHAGFGPLTDAQWRHLAEHSARAGPDGLRLHYDPRIREPFMADTLESIDLWAEFDRMTCPTFVLRGGDSPLFDAATAETMARRGPRATLAVLPGIGHAPSLMAPDQIGLVKGWLGL